MIAVVMAAYNEAAHLDELLPRVATTVNGMPVQVIVVCDGSIDGTCPVAERHGATVVPLPSNQGKWSAVRAGIRVAKRKGASVFVTMDSDGQHDPDALAALVAPLFRSRADIAVGSRYLNNPGRGCAPRNRYLVRVATIAILQRLLRRRYTDPYSGYRAFSAEAIAHLSLRGDRYQGELETLFDAHRLGLLVEELPVAKVYGDDTSKMGAFHGRLWGRLAVLIQYGRVLVRNCSVALRRANRPASSRLAA